jgi:hypothetical protein
MPIPVEASKGVQTKTPVLQFPPFFHSFIPICVNGKHELLRSVRNTKINRQVINVGVEKPTNISSH